MSKPFVHLHLHSEYSVLDGLGKIKKYVLKAMDNGMPAMALTDHGNMFGIKEFFNTVNKVEEEERKKAEADSSYTARTLKPIFGCEIYVNPEGRFTKRGKEDQSANHLVLLAKNLQGYHNLIKIVSIGYIEGYYYKPKVDREILERYHENLICCSACLAGDIPQAILKGDMQRAEECVQWYKRVFGEDFYLEIQSHRTEIEGQSQEVFECQQKVNPVLFEFAEKYGIKCVATNDCHFVNKEDGPVHDRLICLTTNAKIDDEKRLRYTQQEYMKTYEEMLQINLEHPEILDNTLEVADKVERYNIDHSHILPVFPLPEGFTDSNEYLRHLVYKGAAERYDNLLPSIEERIDFELETIKRMGFPDYFLIVQDFIAAARKREIWVGPGRGSAAGSVVAYCLKITNMDPLKYDLLFERFLNPDRISMPDIDVDFEEERRNEIYEYVENMYGKDHVSHVVTFGTMATKSAIKDVARIENLPLPVSNSIAKMIPARLSIEKEVIDKDGKKTKEQETVFPNFKIALQYIPEFKKLYDSSDNPLIRETLKYAGLIEGTVKNTGVHACAVIIGRDPLIQHIPISIAKDTKEKDESGKPKDILVSQFEGSYIEEVGMLKMDFLGLRTLSILKETVRNIKKHRGIDVDIESIPLDDKDTYQLFGNGETIATFQFESPGMQKWLKQLRPHTFEDLIAMVSLYRPGPMQYIPLFVDRKNGKRKIEYELPEMESILRTTYGVTVYQEQVMLLSQKLANFTRGEADSLRKAMGKKKISEMAKLEKKFKEQGVANGLPKDKLDKIWEDWKEFAKYAFNKSHATCYAWISYQTAWLKAHYPAEFMAANLTKNLGDIESITKLMDECRRMKIKVLGPDVNKSGINFTVTDENVENSGPNGNKKRNGKQVSGVIRFGLAAIKGVGTAVAQDIMDGAPYTDIYDFMGRASKGGYLNRKVLESLVYAGAFDSAFPQIRRDQYFTKMAKGKGQTEDETFIDALLRYAQNLNRQSSEVGSLFGEDDEGYKVQQPDIPPIAGAYNNIEFLKQERELVGMFLSSHPLDMYRFELTNFCNITPGELVELLGNMKPEQEAPNRDYYFGGMITNFSQKISQKSGRPFAKFTVEDFTSTIDFTIFGKDYEKYMSYLKDGNAIFIRAQIKKRFNLSDFEVRIQSMSMLANAKESFLKSFTIIVPCNLVDAGFRHDLLQLLKENKPATIKRAASQADAPTGQAVAKVPVYMRIVDSEKGIYLNYATKFKIDVNSELLATLDSMGLDYKGDFNPNPVP